MSCSGKEPSQLTYDADGVAQNVIALIPHNTKWARSKQADAVLYRIELRVSTASGGVPSEALYNFYSPSSRTFIRNWERALLRPLTKACGRCGNR